MRSDQEVEGLLEDWLAETAEPMPQSLLEDVLDGVTRRSQNLPRRLIVLGGLTRGLASLAVLAVLILVTIVITPRVVPQLQSLWRSATGEAPTDPMHWDAMLQFRENPSQLNPAPDGYGHAVVFTYLRGSGPTHDPTQYVPLPAFEAEGIQSWYDPEVDGLLVGWAPGDDMLTMHPSGGGVDSRAAIVAWRNPVTASLKVTGSVEVDATCGDGITFSIEHGTRVFETFALPNGRQAFEHVVDLFYAGEVIYFIVDPGADSRCDTTRFNVTIDTK